MDIYLLVKRHVRNCLPLQERLAEITKEDKQAYVRKTANCCLSATIRRNSHHMTYEYMVISNYIQHQAGIFWLCICFRVIGSIYVLSSFSDTTIYFFFFLICFHGEIYFFFLASKLLFINVGLYPKMSLIFFLFLVFDLPN